MDNSELSAKKRQEDAFGKFYLKNDISRSMIGFFLLFLAIVPYVFDDFTAYGLSKEFYGFVALRSGIWIYTLAQLLYVKHISDYRTYRKLTFSYTIILIIGTLIGNYFQIENFVGQTITVMLLVFFFYLVFPNKFIYQTISSLSIVLGEILLIIFGTNNPISDLLPFFFTFLLIFTVAASTSWEINKQRLKVFQDFDELTETQVKLNEYSKNLEKLVEDRTKELQDSQRLATIGATAGMVGHDIRNPLHAITGDLYLTKLDLTELPDSETKKNMQENVDAIEQNIDYIAKIVADLQDYAKPLKPTIKQVDLEKIIPLLLQKSKIPKNIQTDIQIEADAKEILADSELLNRILTNLIINSIQAMPEGGKLTIQTHKNPDNAIILSVKDTGVGIPDSAKPNLFKPMFTTKSKGQGFGLAVVKRLTEALGGTITFESQEGKGTVFILHFPPQNKT